MLTKELRALAIQLNADISQYNMHSSRDRQACLDYLTCLQSPIPTEVYLNLDGDLVVYTEDESVDEEELAEEYARNNSIKLATTTARWCYTGHAIFQTSGTKDIDSPFAIAKQLAIDLFHKHYAPELDLATVSADQVKTTLLGYGGESLCEFATGSYRFWLEVASLCTPITSVSQYRCQN